MSVCVCVCLYVYVYVNKYLMNYNVFPGHSRDVLFCFVSLAVPCTNHFEAH